MRGVDGQAFLVFRLDPPVEDAAARKDESMRPVLVDDGQLEVAVEGRY
jgi:hypothetical protein